MTACLTLPGTGVWPATSRNSFSTEDTDRDSQRNRNGKGFFQKLSQFAVPL